MKCLLDTHTILWFFDDFEKLSDTEFTAILEPSNKKFVSIISAWELAIKINLGKLTFEGGSEHFFNVIEENGFRLLPIKKNTLSILRHSRLFIATHLIEYLLLQRLLRV